MKKGIDYIGVSARATVFNDKGELFLSKRSQTAKNERGHWETPGGSIEFGETLEQAVKREMLEEYGAGIEIIEQFPAADHLVPGEGHFNLEQSPDYKTFPKLLEILEENIMYKVVKASDGIMRQIAQNKTANNLITKEISPDLSLATTEATDYYEQETTPYNRIYYVLEGELELTIDDETNKLQPGDTCFIGKDTTYEMRGTFKAVTVNQPAFGSEP